MNKTRRTYSAIHHLIFAIARPGIPQRSEELPEGEICLVLLQRDTEEAEVGEYALCPISYSCARETKFLRPLMSFPVTEPTYLGAVYKRTVDGKLNGVLQLANFFGLDVFA